MLGFHKYINVLCSAKQDIPLQKQTLLALAIEKGILILESSDNVLSLLQISLHNSIDGDDEAYRRKPLWLLLLDNDLAWLNLKCVVMNNGLVIVELKDLETHLNRINHCSWGFN